MTLAATSRSSLGLPSNQSNATLSLLPTNQSITSGLILGNSSIDSTKSNGSIATPLNTSSAQPTEDISTAVRADDKELSANTSSAQPTENILTASSARGMNNTSPIASTDNTINNNPSATVSTQSNDTSNNKKSSEKNIPFSPPTSNDQRTPTTLTKDNTTHETAQNESTNPLSDAKVKNKNISSKDSETASSDSVSEKPSSLTGDKTITKVKSPVDNQPEKQSVSSDSIKRDRALFKNYSKYQESVKSQQKEDDDSRHKVPSQDIAEVNNRPVASNDKAITNANTPVNINILRNDKDSDGDKLSIMGLSPPIKGKIESSSDGIITYTPLESWSGTERFGYTISDGRGGVATASVTVIVENQPPEAQDQDVTVNGNNPVKIKLEAKDPDDGKLRFVL